MTDSRSHTFSTGPERRASRSSVRLVIVAGALVVLAAWSALVGFSAYERNELVEHVTERNSMLSRVFAADLNALMAMLRRLGAGDTGSPTTPGSDTDVAAHPVA